MTRAQLGGSLNRYFKKSKEWKDKENRKRLIAQADRIVNMKVFKLIFQELYANKVNDIAIKAETWEANREARLALNGIHEVEERFKQTATMKADPLEEEKAKDKFSII